MTADSAQPSSEHALLLACARGQGGARKAKGIRALVEKPLDWDLLLQAARHHMIMPLVYQSLRASCADKIPKDVLDELHQQFQTTLWQNLHRAGELVRLLDLLARHDISAIPFKGPVLAAVAYGNIALRQFVDLDILVHKHDALKAKGLLKAEGYRQSKREDTPAQEQARLRHGYHCSLEHPGRNVVVELHWSFSLRFLPFPIELEPLWQGLGPVKLADKTVVSLAAEDALLILCFHGSKHLWSRLIWICDVAELIKSQPHLDWEAVMRRAAQLGCERMLLLGLYLAHELLQAPLPPVARQKIQDEAVISLAVNVYGYLFGEATSLGVVEEYGFYLRARERFQDRARLYVELARLVVTPTLEEQALLPLPKPLAFFVKPFWLVARYARARLIQP